MKLLRHLTPTGWAILAAIALIAFVGLGLARPTFLGIQFDPFGNEPLSTDRADRLHASDRFLCDYRPGLCPAPAPVDPAGG